MEKHETQSAEYHWLMDMIQAIDVGMVVIDADFNIQVFNTWMESHSGMNSMEMLDCNLFERFSELPESWLRHKVNTVFTLKARAFMTWEQRPYLFRFASYRPVTSREEFMYQNVTISPLVSVTGEVTHAVLMIYDVTAMATNSLGLESANDELKILSRTDRLTELNNRGFWEERLKDEFGRVKRYEELCSVVMFDIDHFKKVNDTYGHQAGDEVIRMVARVLREEMRTSDIGGRYGGEEFGVILTGTDAESSVVFCERMRKRIEATVVTHEDQKIAVTISLGISQLQAETTDYQEWLEQADQALYKSKESGRNQTTIYQ